MKKILVAALAMSATSVMAAPEAFNAGTPTTRVPAAQTYTYNVDADRANRLFVKNEFDFTLSANVLMNAGEDDPDGRFMVVTTGSAQGRNVYVGHSDGGSVTSCGDPLTAEEAKADGAVATQMAARAVLDASDGNGNGCGEDD